MTEMIRGATYKLTPSMQAECEICANPIRNNFGTFKAEYLCDTVRKEGVLVHKFRARDIDYCPYCGGSVIVITVPAKSANQITDSDISYAMHITIGGENA